MDIAGVVLGSLGTIGLVLTLYQLQRLFRFRKPLFKVEDAELQVQNKEGHLMVGPGKTVLNARGANRAIALREWQVNFLRPNGQPGGGYGTRGLLREGRTPSGLAQAPYLVELPPERWVRFQIDLDILLGMEKEADRPRSSIGIELYLWSPEEVFVVPISFKLTQGEDKYLLDDYKRWRRDAYRTIWRERRGLRRWMRRFLG